MQIDDGSIHHKRKQVDCSWDNSRDGINFRLELIEIVVTCLCYFNNVQIILSGVSYDRLHVAQSNYVTIYLFILKCRDIDGFRAFVACRAVELEVEAHMYVSLIKKTLC